MTTKPSITFMKVETEDASRAWAVMKDGIMTDYQVTSAFGVYRVKMYTGGSWKAQGEPYTTLDKAKTAAKNLALKPEGTSVS